MPSDSRLNLDDLMVAVRDLQRRVADLERGVPHPDSMLVQPGSATAVVVPAMPEGIAPALGRALLGIAGAYLLRAAAESGAVPQLAAVAAAVIYAVAWLIWSTAGSKNYFATAVYGLTAFFILSPMLWETTVRFRVVAPVFSAAILLFFLIFGFALGWIRHITAIVWIGCWIGAVTSVALTIGTRDLLPFTGVLLIAAAVVEWAACRDSWLGQRWVVALGADFAVLLLAFVATRPAGVPEGYTAIPMPSVAAAAVALASIYVCAICSRTLVHKREISGFEVVQSVAVYGILAWATRAGWAFGLSSAVAGAACYAISFGPFHSKTRRIFGGFGIALVLTACLASLHGAMLWGLYCALAVLAMGAGRTLHSAGLHLNSAVYLVAAAVVVHFPRHPASLSAVMAAALLCYFIARRPDTTATVAALFIVMAVASGLLVELLGLRIPVISLLAALLAWTGRYFERRELRWLVYPVMIFGAGALVADFFGNGHKLEIAVSLVFYGGALVFVPRLMRLPGKRAEAEREPLESGSMAGGNACSTFGQRS